MITSRQITKAVSALRERNNLRPSVLENMNHETHCEGSLGEEDQRKDQDLSEALNQIEEACKVFKREAEKLRQEREVVDALSKKVENFHFPSTVKLNVGGHIFETSLQTLTRGAPNSMLAAMFSGKFDLKPAEDGAFFIDRDGTHFRFILNFLRTGTLTLPEDATVFEEVMKEANFYQIQELVDALERPYDPTQSPILGLKVAELFGESMIVITEEHRNALREFLPSGCENWHLLFRASRHGFKAQNFHSRCDYKGPTVTIVQSGDYIFGGFMEISWASGPGKVTHDYLIVVHCFQGLSLACSSPNYFPARNMYQGKITQYKS